jgi:hypothetical protein
MDLHGAYAGIARHAAVEAAVVVLVVLERDFDEIEMRGPAGKDNAVTS